MKRLLFPIIALATIVVMSGCGSSKGVAYFTNIDSTSLAASRGLYDAKIMPKDELTISVHTTDPAAASPFNIETSSGASGASKGYLVDNDGFISFPLIGRVHVAGLTKTECEAMIKNKIKPYLAATENPVVMVRMSSYRITVIGEVANPGVIPVSTEKISVVEALAQSGDLTIFGKRNNIMLIREDANGQKHETRLNLNDANLINSPYYYLQQNDILYVEPNSAKAKSANIGQSTTMWFSFVGIVTSVASMLVTVLK